MNHSEKFYRHCYRATNGWIPMMPLGSELRLGDFGQLKNSEFLPLGNIFKLKNIPRDLPGGEEPTIKARTNIELNSSDWQMQEGIEVTTSIKQHTSSDYNSEDISSLLLREKAIWFDSAGSFSFGCRNPKGEFIVNWNQVNQLVMLGLTLIEHSFREVYVVTRLASVDAWELAISKVADAELEVVSTLHDEHKHRDGFDESEVIRHAKGLEFYDKAHDRSAHFFQAKKLIMSDVKRDYYTDQILSQQGDLPPHIIANLLKSDLLNHVKENELNQPYFEPHQDKKIEPSCKINVAPYFEFFEWTDLSLDDITKLC